MTQDLKKKVDLTSQKVKELYIDHLKTNVASCEPQDFVKQSLNRETDLKKPRIIYDLKLDQPSFLTPQKAENYDQFRRAIQDKVKDILLQSEAHRLKMLI